MISPSHGGGVISFQAFGEPVLKSAPVPMSGPTDPAAFVLLPYCNRIADGHAEFEGEALQLMSTLSGEPHALHGEGWISKWEVKTRSETSAELFYVHKPTNGTWPWAFEATQYYELSANRLVHRLKIQNISERQMPAGLGFHPYFPREVGDGFAAHVEGKWNVQDDLLPTLHEDGCADDYWPNDQLNSGLPLDHCFTGWNGKLTLTRKNFQICLAASEELGLLHVYAPVDAGFFCAEPVSHMPDALNRPGEPDQMQVLQPGEIFKASISYLIEKSA
ncbi:aldose 1-epimerase [Parvibaculaceae bacterium PLY_AMNH_Bact1]|nr:aldose 1-epimerase [Parvibaculaceae bacterium PLY_AMNH_Bact1]